VIDRLVRACAREQAAVCAISGLRGVGKTQLAGAYARAKLELAGWVNAEGRDTLLADLARVAEAVGVANPDGDWAKSARRLRGHLEASADDSLMAFHNAVAPDVLRPSLSAAGHVQLVITTTNSAFSEFGQVIDVQQFSPAESLRHPAEGTGAPTRAVPQLWPRS